MDAFLVQSLACILMLWLLSVQERLLAGWWYLSQIVVLQPLASLLILFWLLRFDKIHPKTPGKKNECQKT